MKIIVNIVLLIFFPSLVFSQLYPYSTEIYQNIERNPTYVLSPDYKTAVFFSHHGSLPGTNNYYSDEIKFQHYFERIFSGIGFFVSHNSLNDSSGYNYAGFSAAYRNVLFDKAYVKIGIAYKLIKNKSVSGICDDFTIFSYDSIVKRNDISNFNASFTVSSPSDFYFFSVGICNVNPFVTYNTNKNPFLVQAHASIGNIFSLFNSPLKNYLSFTYLENMFPDGKFYSRGYFMTLWSVLRINRRTSVVCGLSGGCYEKRYYQITPFLKFAKTKFAIKVGGDFFVSLKNYKNSYNFLPQFGLIKTF